MKKFCDPQLFHGPPYSEEMIAPHLILKVENDVKMALVPGFVGAGHICAKGFLDSNFWVIDNDQFFTKFPQISLIYKIVFF